MSAPLVDITPAIVSRPRHNDRKARNVAVLNLETGKIGEARIHSLAYHGAGIDLVDLDNDHPLGDLAETPALQGEMTVGGLFWDYEHYYGVTAGGYIDNGPGD